MHIFLELGCAFFSFLIIVPLLLTFVLDRQRFRLCLGMGFLVAGIVNVLHVLIVHKISMEYASSAEFFTPLTGILPRFIIPVTLIIAMICDRYCKESKQPTNEVFTVGPLLILTLIFLSIILGKIEPSAGLIAKQSFISRPQDLVAGIIGIILLLFFKNKTGVLWKSLFAGLILISLSSIVLAFSSSFESLLYVFAHILKFLSFLTFAVGVIADIWKIRNIERERYELYETLRHEKQFVENVLRSIGDGVYTTNTEKRIITWSRGAELLTGYRSNEVIGMKCSEFLKHRDDKGNILCNTPHCPITQVIERNTIIGPVTTNITSKFGVNRKIDIVTAPVIEVGGELLNIVEVFRDVTEEKYAQNQLKVAHEKLLKLDEFKNNLIQMIVHDLKNPLTAIISTIELMEYEPGMSENEKKESYKIISSESRRLLNMITSLLDVEKMESGKMRIEKVPLIIKDIINYEVNLLKRQSELSNVKIECNIDKNLSICTGDHNLISRTIMNLLDNAIKYARSRIIVSAFNSNENPDEIVVTVENDGPGIPKEFRNKIFEKFEAVEMRKKGKKYSTGLGLAFCKMAVEVLGGRIWVEDSDAGGAKFCFTLPVAEGGS